MDMKKTVKQTAKLLGIKGKLKRTQVKAINDGLSGYDLLVIAPTSFGKSAIFQIPSIIKGGLSIVIVPTLSLLHDQTDRLQQLGISVGVLASDCPSWDEADIQTALNERGYLLLYTTPESLWKLDLSDIAVTYLVVDECHCVTSWGYGFRNAYLKIGDFVDQLSPRPHVIALTATAPLTDRSQIRQLLHMRHIKEYVISLCRPKLTFSAYTFVSEDARQKKLKSLLRKHMKTSDGACIIYCNIKRNAQIVYDLVRKWYPEQVAICHSNLPSGTRKWNEKQFLHGKRHIMVATSAFGMGVDKADVRLIIHYNLPLSLIDYYQQAGRAGRDGGKARCVLLYKKSDYNTNRYVIEQNQKAEALDYTLHALDEMKEYADTEQGCMVQRMLAALGENREKPCGKCTFCQKARKQG